MINQVFPFNISKNIAKTLNLLYNLYTNKNCNWILHEVSHEDHG